MSRNQSLNIWLCLACILERCSVHKDLGFTSLHISIKRYFLLNCCRTTFFTGSTFDFLVVCSCIHPMTLSYSKQHLLFAYLDALVWWKMEEGVICANLTPTPYSQWHRTLYMSASAQWRRWNAHSQYISSFEKYCLCASFFPAGNYSNSSPLPSPTLHLSTLWKKKESYYFYIYFLNSCYIFWVLHLQLAFNPTFHVFFPYTYKNWKDIPEKCLKNHQGCRGDTAQMCAYVHISKHATSLQGLLRMQNLP